MLGAVWHGLLLGRLPHILSHRQAWQNNHLHRLAWRGLEQRDCRTKRNQRAGQQRLGVVAQSPVSLLGCLCRTRRGKHQPRVLRHRSLDSCGQAAWCTQGRGADTPRLA